MNKKQIDLGKDLTLAKMDQNLENAGTNAAETKKPKAERKAAQSRPAKHRENLERLTNNRNSARWF